MSYPAPQGPIAMQDILEGITRAPDWEFVNLFNPGGGQPIDHVRVRHSVSGEVNDLHYERVGDGPGQATYALVMQAVIP